MRRFWAAGLAILVLGFGAGFLVAMGLNGAFAPRGVAGGVQTASDAWSLFRIVLRGQVLLSLRPV